MKEIGKTSDGKFVCKHCGKTFERESEATGHLAQCPRRNYKQKSKESKTDNANPNLPPLLDPRLLVLDPRLLDPLQLILQKIEELEEKQERIIQNQENHISHLSELALSMPLPKLIGGVSLFWGFWKISSCQNEFAQCLLTKAGNCKEVRRECESIGWLAVGIGAVLLFEIGKNLLAKWFLGRLGKIADKELERRFLK